MLPGGLGRTGGLRLADATGRVALASRAGESQRELLLKRHICSLIFEKIAHVDVEHEHLGQATLRHERHSTLRAHEQIEHA